MWHLTALLAATILAGCGNETRDDAPAGFSATPTIAPVVIRTLPHDTAAFTQGFLCHDGMLYESTGAPDNRISSLRAIDPATGAIVRRRDIPSLFAEGLAVYDDHLVQLTWRDRTALVYGISDFALRGQFSYAGEGWGLTSDGASFIMSNGSDTIYYRNSSFEITRTLPVTIEGKPLKKLNELEFVNGLIYANVWYSTFIFEIDAADGAVRRIIDCTPLVESAHLPSEHHVLNGVAWCGRSETFYLTGKDWPVIFEVRFP